MKITFEHVHVYYGEEVWRVFVDGVEMRAFSAETREEAKCLALDWLAEMFTGYTRGVRSGQIDDMLKPWEPRT